MSKKKIELDISYKVVNINTTKFSSKEADADYIENLFSKEDNLDIELGVGLGIDKDKSQITFEINTSLSERDSDDVLISHTGKTTFAIKGLENTIVNGTDSYDLPDALVIQLYSLSFSHARALLSVELNRTVFKDKFYLPVIDPSNIIKDKTAL